VTAGEFIQPNLHVAVIHFPIALLVIGTFIECFSFLGWRGSSFRVAGRWMILLGAVLAVPVALSGLYALRDVLAGGEDGFASWNDLVATSAVAQNPEVWDVLERHLWLGSFAAGVALLAVLTWIACADRWRVRLHGLLAALLLFATVVTLWTAHTGGKLVHDFALSQVAADPERTAKTIVPPIATVISTQPIDGPVVPADPPPEPAPPPPAPPVATQPATDAAVPTTAPTTAAAPLPPPQAPAAVPSDPPPPPDAAASVEPAPEPATPDPFWVRSDHLARYLPPLQVHVLLAGLTASLSLLATALSIRRCVEPAYPLPPLDPPSTPEQDRIAAIFSRPAEVDADLDTPWHDRGPVSPPPRPTVPSARFHLLATALAILTAVMGTWYLAGQTREVSPQRLWDVVIAPEQNVNADNEAVSPTRRLAHVVAGGLLVVLPIVLAGFARFAPRSRWPLLLLSLLLVAVTVAQLWLGVLLLLDTNVGPVNAFQPPP
jgi:uncharacterized membrane protein